MEAVPEEVARINTTRLQHMSKDEFVEGTSGYDENE